MNVLRLQITVELEQSPDEARNHNWIEHKNLDYEFKLCMFPHQELFSDPSALYGASSRLLKR
jgi:hypothetical protein